MDINWNDFITVDNKWVIEHLNEHSTRLENKLILRTYSVRLKGIDYDTTDLISFFKNSIKNYVLTEREIAAVERSNGDPFDEALQYFGEIDPTYDGRFGELILYLLVEAILKVPMVVFKIPSNANDQVKGADGIFIGEYDKQPAILIGEAKTWGDLGKALNSAFDSLNRFHSTEGEKILKYEYLVAKKGIKNNNLSTEQLDKLYDCFTIGSPANKERNIVHPVLIVYDDVRINELKSETPEKAGAKLNSLLEEKLNDHFSVLKSLCEKYNDVSKVYLDFFFLPLTSVDDFRKKLYFAIHGTVPPVSKRRKKGTSKKTVK